MIENGYRCLQKPWAELWIEMGNKNWAVIWANRIRNELSISNSEGEFLPSAKVRRFDVTIVCDGRWNCKKKPWNSCNFMKFTYTNYGRFVQKSFCLRSYKEISRMVVSLALRQSVPYLNAGTLRSFRRLDSPFSLSVF